MNQDVLKSLAYLIKSLKMSNRAISNAINNDPNDKSDYTIVQEAIQDLIDIIDNSKVVPIQPPAISISPIVQTVAQKDSLDSSNPFNFLDP